MEEEIESHFEGNQLVVESGGDSETYDCQFLVAALLVSIAKADGTISAEETDQMLQLINEHFRLRNAEALELLRRAMTNIAEDPDLDALLKDLGAKLTDTDRSDVALMMVKVVSANGKADADEMARLRRSAGLIGIGPEGLQDAFDRHLSETFTGD